MQTNRPIFFFFKAGLYEFVWSEESRPNVVKKKKKEKKKVKNQF